MLTFPCLLHKLSVILTLKNGVKNVQAAAYNDARTVSSLILNFAFDTQGRLECFEYLQNFDQN